jgi:hypothetical protein
VIFRISSRAMRKWITATLLIATAAVAQQTHNQYEPTNAPGAGQKLLAQFRGDWDVVKTFFPMNGKPIVTKGTCKHLPTDCILVSNKVENNGNDWPPKP